MKKIIIAAVAVLLSAVLYLGFFRHPDISIEKTDNAEAAADAILKEIVRNANEEGVAFYIEDGEITEPEYQVYFSDHMQLMVPLAAFTDKLNCSVNVYENGTITFEKGENLVKVYGGSNLVNINGNVIQTIDKPEKKEDKIYVPVNEICETLNYTCTIDLEKNTVCLSKISEEEKLPAVYDMRESDRVSPVRDQGIYGTCWAFASLAALETTILPEENMIFSVDHMTLNNSFNVSPFDGGEYYMSIAYLAAWQGPVLEEDDKYGDNKTVDGLKAVKHLEEAIILKDKNYQDIKSAVYKYGGVETVLYCDMQNAYSSSVYYNEKRSSYYYNGEHTPNHDVVIVGWDDNYPKEYFRTEPEGDGAFICKNSWGTDFGEDGFFYISYYDTNIGMNSVAYTKLGDSDNYDKIYQSDLMGEVGTMGFDDKTEAYFANVYTAGEKEELKAVSFYATGVKTTYEVYVVTDFTGVEDLQKRTKAASGEMEYEGYYTINLNEAVRLPDNKKFAVIVRVNTQDSMPIAIEYKNDEKTANFDITDGEGYISLYGTKWSSAEEENDCNVCLKAFTDICEE